MRGLISQSRLCNKAGAIRCGIEFRVKAVIERVELHPEDTASLINTNVCLIRLKRDRNVGSARNYFFGIFVLERMKHVDDG